MNTRREFIGGGMALAAMSGCRGIGGVAAGGPVAKDGDVRSVLVHLGHNMWCDWYPEGFDLEAELPLKKAGVKLLYAEESVPDGPEGIILESVLEGLAEYYSADLKQKVSRGIRETAKKGEWTFSLPMGYTRDEHRHIIINEHEAEAVREAFRLHIAGATTKEIEDMFEERGIRGKRGAARVSAEGRSPWRVRPRRPAGGSGRSGRSPASAGHRRDSCRCSSG